MAFKFVPLVDQFDTQLFPRLWPRVHSAVQLAWNDASPAPCLRMTWSSKTKFHKGSTKSRIHGFMRCWVSSYVIYGGNCEPSDKAP